MNRLEAIRLFKEKEDAKEAEKAKRAKEEFENLKDEIKKMNNRVLELLDVGNATLKADIIEPLCVFEASDNSLGFIFCPDGYKGIAGLGIRKNRELCVPDVILTGKDVYCMYITDSKKINFVPLTIDCVEVLKQIIKEYDSFEKKFYDCIDDITENNNPE